MGPIGASIVYISLISLLFPDQWLAHWIREGWTRWKTKILAFLFFILARRETSRRKSPQEAALERRAADLEKQAKQLQEQVRAVLPALVPICSRCRN